MAKFPEAWSEACSIGEQVRDPRLQSLYQEIIDKLLSDVEVDLPSIFALQAERIAALYIFTKMREQDKLGGFRGSSSHKDHISLWASLVKQFNEGAEKYKSSLWDERYKTIVSALGQALNEQLDISADTRREIASRFSSILDKSGF